MKNKKFKSNHTQSFAAKTSQQLTKMIRSISKRQILNYGLMGHNMTSTKKWSSIGITWPFFYLKHPSIAQISNKKMKLHYVKGKNKFYPWLHAIVNGKLIHQQGQHRHENSRFIEDTTFLRKLSNAQTVLEECTEIAWIKIIDNQRIRRKHEQADLMRTFCSIYLCKKVFPFLWIE